MRVLVLSLLISTVIWSVHLVLSYYLAWADCVGNDASLLILRHLATIVAQAATLAVFVGALRVATRRTVVATEHRQADGYEMERRFLARLTVMLSAMFLFAIAMAGAASLVLPACV